MDDLDDLDLTTQAPAPSRPSKFAPKNAKVNLKPKSEPDAKPASVPKPEVGAPISKERNAKPPVTLTTPKAEPSTLNESASVMKMEVDAKAADGVEHEPAPDKANDVPMTEAAEEEDVVVREIDVFFNPSLGDDTQLYVLQYPLRPTWRPYDMDEKCKEVRVKPKSTEVEVDLSIDTDSKNYDPDAQYTVKKQTLLTRWTPMQTSGYAVGVLNDDKLYLNPVHAVVQLRPSMNHIKPKMKNSATVNTEEPKGGSGGPSKKLAQNKPVESSTEGKTDDEDCWVSLKYHGLDSDLSAGYLKSMVAQKSSPIQFTMSPYDYMNSLCPGVSNNDRPKGLSKRYLLSLPLEERIKKLLCEGPTLHRFNALKHFAPDHSVEELLGVLQQHAILIQGLWTAKTGLLRLQDASKSSLARDYALTLFNKNLAVKLENVHMPWGSFLGSFGIERPSFKDMKFKEPPDVSFMKLYPDIVKKQRVILDGIEAGVNQQLLKIRTRGPGGRNRPREKNALATPTVTGKPSSLTSSDQGTKKGASEAPVGKTMSAETLEALPKALQKLFQNQKVCSYGQICQGLRDMAVSKSALPKADAKMAVDAAYAADAPLKEFQEVISNIAVDIHGSYVLRKSPEHPEHDPLRKVVIDLFLGKEANARLKRADVVEAAKFVLKRDITNNEYNKVMNDLCESKGSAWFLKSGN